MSKELQSIAKPFDIYGDMQVPFDVATWCRGHKFNPAAVTVSRLIRERNFATEQMHRLEQQREVIEQELRDVCASIAENKLGATNGI